MNGNPSNVLQICALCDANRKLERSHIIPQFVHRWCRKTPGPTNLIRGKAILGRGTDESTRQMLCGQCEDLFSSFESEFARVIFHPTATGFTLRAKYGGWLRKFAVSVCWRILEEKLAETPIDSFLGRWAPELASCRATWKQYLAGKRPDVGEHHVHILACPIESSGSLEVTRAGNNWPNPTRDRNDRPLKNRPDREVERTVDSEISCGDTGAFVYAKLGPIILFGLIAESVRSEWQGTRINFEGKLKPRAILIPARYRDYLTLSRVSRE